MLKVLLEGWSVGIDIERKNIQFHFYSCPESRGVAAVGVAVGPARAFHYITVGNLNIALPDASPRLPSARPFHNG